MKKSISNSCVRKICKQSFNNNAYKADISLIDKEISERLQENKLINWKAVNSSCKTAINRLIDDNYALTINDNCELTMNIANNNRAQMIDALLNYFKNKYK